MRHVAGHLQRRVGEAVAERRQPVGEAQREADAAADDQPGHSLQDAHAHVVRQLAGQRHAPGRTLATGEGLAGNV